MATNMITTFFSIFINIGIYRYIICCQFADNPDDDWIWLCKTNTVGIKRGSRILRAEWPKMLHLVSFEVCVLLLQWLLDKLIILSYFFVAFMDNEDCFHWFHYNISLSQLCALLKAAVHCLFEKHFPISHCGAAALHLTVNLKAYSFWKIKALWKRNDDCFVFFNQYVHHTG